MNSNYNSILNLSFDDARKTSLSRNAKTFFYDNGYLKINNIVDPLLLKENPPEEFGQFTFKKIDSQNFSIYKEDVESQVPGSTSRYSYPPYIKYHTDIRLKIEKIIGEKLYNTYFYDRFYFVNQDLKKHKDRDSCEISISVQISTNSPNPWDFSLETLKGKNVSVGLNDGSGLLYLGCDVMHWRDPLKSRHKFLKRKLYNFIKKDDDTYHHQIFFHYVRANGHRCHFAKDALTS